MKKKMIEVQIFRTIANRIDPRKVDQICEIMFDAISSLPEDSEIKVITDKTGRPALELAIGNEQSGWLLEQIGR